MTAQQSTETRKAPMIGTQFTLRGCKNKSIWTVEDILTTTNTEGKVVETRYVASKEFCGQRITDRDFNALTILVGLVKV